MKKYLATLLLVFLVSCAPPAPPEVSVSVSPSPLMRGVQASIHISVKNPGKSDWKDFKIMVGYTPENEDGIRLVKELPLSLAAGQVFQQDVPWQVDFQPKPDVKYQIRLVLLSSSDSTMAETAIPVEFVLPVIQISIDPDQLTANSQAAISVQLTNPSGADLQGCSLSITYGAENDPSGFLIEDIPLSLQAGETFRKEITWTVEYIPSSGSYEVVADLLSPAKVVLASAKAPITLSIP